MGIWTNIPDMNFLHYQFAGCGSNNNGFAISTKDFSAQYHEKSESYNGTTWNVEDDLNSEKVLGGATGTVSACIAGTGRWVSTSHPETYDGTSWTTISDENTKREQL